MKNQVIGYAKWLGDSGDYWDKGEVYKVYYKDETESVVSTKNENRSIFLSGLWKLADTEEELRPKTAKDVLREAMKIYPLNCCDLKKILGKPVVGCKGCPVEVSNNCTEEKLKWIEELE